MTEIWLSSDNYFGYIFLQTYFDQGLDNLYRLVPTCESNHTAYSVHEPLVAMTLVANEQITKTGIREYNTDEF